jgi:hypothetical protein
MSKGMKSDYAYESEKENMKDIKNLSGFLPAISRLKTCFGKKFLYAIRDVNARTELLRQRNQIVRDIHTEFRALNIEIPTVVEKNSENFSKILEEIIDDSE